MTALAVTFAILKVLRIILFVVLAILILLLFVPFIYKIDAESEQKNISAKLQWFFGIIGFYAIVDGTNIKVFLKVLFFKKYFYGNPNKKKTIVLKDDLKTNKEDAEKESVSDLKGNNQFINDLDDTGFDWDPDEYDDTDDIKQAGLFAEAKEIFSTLNRLRETNIISYTYPKISRFLHRIRPRKVTGDIHFGFEDPANTGMVTGFIAMMPFLYGTDLNIEPEFDCEKSFFEGNLHARGRIFVFDALIVVLRLFGDKYFRRKLKRVRNKI